MCIYAYCHSQEHKPQLFIGKCHGQILRVPRGESDFGWDPIISPNGYSLTYAEMKPDDKNSISHRAIALKELATFLN